MTLQKNERTKESERKTRLERQEDIPRAHGEKERSGSGWHVMKGDIDCAYREEREKRRREEIKSGGGRRTERSRRTGGRGSEETRTEESEDEQEIERCVWSGEGGG